MRISDVNSDNYMTLMKMFGGKSSPALDAMQGKNATSGKELTAKEMEAKLVASGHVEEGMFIGGGDTSWKKTVPVSDEIKDKLISTVQKQFAKNANGMGTTEDGDEIGAIMKEYRKNISPDERLSVTWTMEQIVRDESTRLVSFVKANDPGWESGKEIDKDILNNAISSSGIDIRA